MTNRQILGRLQAELRGWKVETTRHHDAFVVTSPTGSVTRKRFDSVRNPVALQSAIQEIRRGGRH